MKRPADEGKNANTYVLDGESATEMARLTHQHGIVTKFMDGLLPDCIELSEKSTILDVACGPGGWVLDVAFERPKSQVFGIDISKIAVEYADARARTQGLDDNAIFKIMDATKQLDFPDASFDLVNARFLIGFLPPPAWPGFVKECLRITRPGGYIRLTECDDMGTTTSPAFEQLWNMCSLAFKRANRSFAPESRNFNITPMLGQFIRRAGYNQIKTIAHVVDFSAHTEAHESMFQDWMIGLQLLQPFLVKMEVTTQEKADSLHQKALMEMMDDDFRALWYFASVIGQRPA